MAVGIELESRLPGVRGPKVQGGAYLPSVQDGVSAALGDALKNLPKAALNADFHTRVEAINKMDLQNQMAEAELAFDRWNAQAMWGKEGDTPTTLDVFNGEKDATKRAMGLRGLMRLKGNAAAAAAGMYGQASDTAINDILNGLSPQVRATMRNRLLASRNATLTRMEYHGFTQREAAVRAQNSALMDARARLNAEEAASAAKRVEGERYDERLRAAEAAYETSLASIPTKEVYEQSAAQLKGFGAIPYEDYKRESEETARKNRDGAVAAITAERDAAFAAVGAEYAVKQKALREQRRAAVLDSLGVTEKDVSGNPQLAFAVEGQLAAYEQKSGAAFVESMIEAGNLSFAKSALADDARLISDYGITDSRVRTALREKLQYAETKKARERNQKNEMVGLEVSRAGLLAPNGVDWAYDTDYFVALRDKAEQEGDNDAAARYNGVIANRQKAAAEAAKLQEKELLKAQEGLPPPGALTQDQWKSLVTQIALNEKPYWSFTEGGETFFLSKPSLIKHIVFNRMGLTKEKATALYDSYELGNPDGDKATVGMRTALEGRRFGGTGFSWQALEDISIPLNKGGELDGDLYPVRPVSEDPRNASLFVVDGEKGASVNKEAVMGQLFYTSAQGPLPLTDNEATLLFSTWREAIQSYIGAHPEATQSEINLESEKLLRELTVGDVSLDGNALNLIPEITGGTLLERTSSMQAYAMRWKRIKAERLRKLTDGNDETLAGRLGAKIDKGGQE